MIENKKDDKKSGKGKENKAPKGRFITVQLYNHICSRVGDLFDFFDFNSLFFDFN